MEDSSPLTSRLGRRRMSAATAWPCGRSMKVRGTVMDEYILLRRRSFMQRLLRSPPVFCSHYKAFRVFGARRLAAMHASFLFTKILFSFRETA